MEERKVEELWVVEEGKREALWVVEEGKGGRNRQYCKFLPRLLWV